MVLQAPITRRRPLSSTFPKPQQLISSPHHHHHHHHHLRRGLFHSSAPNLGNKSLITRSMISPNLGSLLFTVLSTLQATASSNRCCSLPLSSKIAKRRGRLPGIVPAAYAKVMKRLNFCA